MKMKTATTTHPLKEQKGQGSFPLMKFMALMYFLSTSAYAQQTQLLTNTTPATTWGAITFNLSTTQEIRIDTIFVATDGSASDLEVWYKPTGLNAQPLSTDFAPPTQLWFTALASQSVPAATPVAALVIPNGLIVPANSNYGIYIGNTTFATTGVRYSSAIPSPDSVTNGVVSIRSGTNTGFGWVRNGTTTNHPRAYSGGISYSIPVHGPNNASISALVAPTIFCGGSQDIIVRLKNNGNNLLNNVTVNWSLDGVLQTPIPWTYPLDTFGSTIYPNDTAITLGNVVFGSTSKALKAWTSMPNSVPDTVNLDDTLNTIISPSLNGTYTVGGVGADYTTVSDAANALAAYGICGPVTFNVTASSGPYIGSVGFSNINGSSDINTITFNGNGNTITSSNSPIVSFSGSQYINFNGFNIIGDSLFTTGFGIHIGNQSHHLTINNNTVDVGMTSTSSTNAGIVVSGSTASATTTGNNAQNLTITNNEVIGGYYGMTFIGSGSYLNNSGHLIQNNIIRDFYAYGIYLSSADTVQVINNDIHRMNRPSVTTFYGIYQTTSRNTKIIGNKVHDAGTASYTAYPMYLTTSVNSPGYETEFINNQIYNIYTTTTIYGMYLLGTRDGVNLYHNTISLDLVSNSGTIRAIYMSTVPTNHNVKNNSVTVSGVGSGTKYALYVSSTTATSNFDYNNYLMTATSGTSYLAYWGGNRVDLAALQTASSQDSNSVSIDPLFINPSVGNLEPFSSAFDNLGTPVGVLNDINGGPRSSTNPDIGSVEFTIPFCTAPPVAGNTLTDNATACKGQDFTLSFDSLTTTGIGQTYQWEVANDSVGPYTAMVNDTNIFTITNQLKTHWYRIALTCSGLTSTTVPVMVYTDSVGVPAALTIDTALAVSATNFHTLTDLASLINCKGVSAPTTITLAPYNMTFNENVDFGTIGGASDINTITLFGNGNTLESAGSTVLTFSNTSYLTVDSLNIVASGSTGYGVHISNASQHITIRKSRIEVSTTSTSTLTQPIVVSGSLSSPTTSGNNGQYIIIENNEIIGGYYSITMMGNVGPADNYGHKISNNTIRDFYAYGIYLSYADSTSIENNDINRANRTTVTTLYAIYPSECKFLKINRNSIHATGGASYSAYPIYLSHLASDSLYESEIINNRIFNIDNVGTFYGIYALTTSLENIKMYHNTIQHEQPAGNTGTIRGFYSSVSHTNVDFRNNIVSLSGTGTGAETGIYMSSTSTSFISDNNAINVTTGDYGYWGGAQATLLDWQTATSLGVASNDSDPAFTDVTANNLVPLSGNIDNIGAPVGVLTDLAGNARSTTTPDPGAYEFTGVAGDFAIIGGELIRSGDCYSFNDTISITVQNLIGSTVDFSITPITIDWSVTGPQISSGFLTRSFGTLAPGASITLTDYNVNRSMAGTYTLHANLQTSSFNLVTVNDTLQQADFEVKPLLKVSPKTITVNSPTDTVVLTANSPLFPSAGFFITEVCHYKYTVGAPTAGWPSYMLADDYIEITGSPNSDLAGIILEQYDASTMVASYTFPTGTLLSPSGTAIIAIGQLTGSVDSPTDFYYNGTGTYTGTWGSGTAAGVVLREASSGTIMDAVGYSTYTFPAVSGVTAADWSGNTPSGTTTSGNRLVGADVNSATNWVNSSTAPQDPNAVNPGVTVPVPSTLLGFDWNYLGSSFSNSPKVTVGPYTTPGIYTYIASYSNACGVFYDTVYVTAGPSVPVKLVYFNANAKNEDAHLTWQTASEINNSHFEVQRSTDGKRFKTIGTVKGNGTTSKVHNYQFMDEGAAQLGNTIYYRLHQVDYNGDDEFSPTATVRFESNQLQTVSISPNPFNTELNLSIIASKESNVTITITDLQGRLLSTESFTATNGANTLSLNHMTKLEKGFYFVRVKMDGETKVIKVLRN
jgi:hypothetical protein